jgi:hypothetical protein
MPRLDHYAHVRGHFHCIGQNPIPRLTPGCPVGPAASRDSACATSVRVHLANVETRLLKETPIRRFAKTRIKPSIARSQWIAQ